MRKTGEGTKYHVEESRKDKQTATWSRSSECIYAAASTWTARQ
jgi:hypothetical protein